MSATAILTMLVICGVVWGGFAVLLTRAIRSESAKEKREGGGEA